MAPGIYFFLDFLFNFYLFCCNGNFLIIKNHVVMVKVVIVKRWKCILLQLFFFHFIFCFLCLLGCFGRLCSKNDYVLRKMLCCEAMINVSGLLNALSTALGLPGLQNLAQNLGQNMGQNAGGNMPNNMGGMNQMGASGGASNSHSQSGIKYSCQASVQAKQVSELSNQ